MKVFNFCAIAFGIMVLLYLGGVNTNTSNLLNSILIQNVSQISSNATIVPTASTTFNFGVNFWTTVLLVLGAMLLFGGFKIGIGGTQITPALDGLFAAVAGGLWVLFFLDFVTLLKLIYGTTGGTGWTFWVVAILLTFFLFLFAISVIEFVRGND